MQKYVDMKLEKTARLRLGSMLDMWSYVGPYGELAKTKSKNSKKAAPGVTETGGGDRKLEGIIDIKKRKAGKKLRNIQPVSNELMEPPPDEADAKRVGVQCIRLDETVRRLFWGILQLQWRGCMSTNHVERIIHCLYVRKLKHLSKTVAA